VIVWSDKAQWTIALELAVMQFMSYAICTISWRAVSQANIWASVFADAAYGSFQFFVIQKLVKHKDADTFIPWIGYTIGGVIGTVAGIYLSLWWLGK